MRISGQDAIDQPAGGLWTLYLNPILHGFTIDVGEGMSQLVILDLSRRTVFTQPVSGKATWHYFAKIGHICGETALEE